MFSYGKENAVPVTPVAQKHERGLEESKNAPLTSKHTANGTPAGRNAPRTVLGGKSTNIRKIYSEGGEALPPSFAPSAPPLLKPSPMDVSMDSPSALQTPSPTGDDSMVHEHSNPPSLKSIAENENLTFLNEDIRQDTTHHHFSHIPSPDNDEADDLEYMPPTASTDPLSNLGFEDVSIDFDQLGKCWTTELAQSGQTKFAQERSVSPSRTISSPRAPTFRVFEEAPSVTNNCKLDLPKVADRHTDKINERVDEIELPLLDLDTGLPLSEKNPNTSSTSARNDMPNKLLASSIPKSQPSISRIRKPSSLSSSTPRKSLPRPLLKSRALHSRLSRSRSGALSSTRRRPPVRANSSLKIDCSSLDADLL
ncbi:securin, partial [Schizosaccharomyces cryophilus OY26]